MTFMTMTPLTLPFAHQPCTHAGTVNPKQTQCHSSHKTLDRPKSSSCTCSTSTWTGQHHQWSRCLQGTLSASWTRQCMTRRTSVQASQIRTQVPAHHSRSRGRRCTCKCHNLLLFKADSGRRLDIWGGGNWSKGWARRCLKGGRWDKDLGAQLWGVDKRTVWGLFAQFRRSYILIQGGLCVHV